MQRGYEVSVSTMPVEHGHIGFASIEVVPPLSHELADMVCRKVVRFFDEHTAPSRSGHSGEPYVVTPKGFRGEGTRSTVFTVETTPTMRPNLAEEWTTAVQRRVEQIISPSGYAIRRRT